MYTITGKVIKGDGYGKKLGFPTVNLDAQIESKALSGVYGGKAILDDVVYKAGIVINDAGRIEAHLIGYSRDAYGREVTLQINKFLREYKKFNTEQKLIAQIKKDLIICSQA
ncbi:hypothetical protein A3H53_02485 [Candidatus Nomurabacteria bacterium RIFCSPLOWO2_02_FULL_40_10]|uniref:riboflavin kinase n=2 Tax=Candidatus Nomuraibacteriota TaxID=1752729 RepID=A0A1F6Y0K9_9BACT|nr:MAG: hypothetical protein A2642_00095 [Candidatus Nomurabacteria bacterium RIFCSPHIGHO2_01_FULL_39_10]OGI99874.1 MAG: hypothetical protein A3H53_02485 [Candidatus Nomurabacteria bacterium RIFCSPLOWO2_02_FULL_40_10]